jgi:hypothetical protein
MRYKKIRPVRVDFLIHMRNNGTILLALQLQLPFQVGLFSFGLVAAAPDGPSDDESGFDPALG